MQRRYVTSMSRRIFDRYGEAMLETFCRHWPSGDLQVYTEAGSLPFSDPRVTYYHLLEIPGLAHFLEGVGHFDVFQGIIDGKRNYRYNVFTFARKAFAQMAAAKDYKGYLYWIDADVVTHKPVPATMIEGAIEGNFMAILKRKTWHICTSFVAWDCGHAMSAEWWPHYRNVYQTGAVFLLPYWDDCAILEATINGLPAINDLGAPYTGEGPYNIFDLAFQGLATHDKGVYKAENRYDQLLNLVHAVKPPRILEIGTWNGGRAIEMHDASPDSEYIGFDLFELADQDSDKREKNVKRHYSLSEVERRLSEKGIKHTLYRGDSKDTLPRYLHEFGERSAELIFIDGGHSVETIRGDLDNARKAIKPGGIIVMDDYYTDMPPHDLETYGAQVVLKDIPHMVMPIRDHVRGGGRVQMAVIEC